jgi:cytolysin (calcineurin-like family phosphatase)
VKLKHALVGLAALGGAALSAGTASAMPIGLATNADIASNVEQGRSFTFFEARSINFVIVVYSE